MCCTFQMPAPQLKMGAENPQLIRNFHFPHSIPKQQRALLCRPHGHRSPVTEGERRSCCPVTLRATDTGSQPENPILWDRSFCLPGVPFLTPPPTHSSTSPSIYTSKKRHPALLPSGDPSRVPLSLGYAVLHSVWRHLCTYRAQTAIVQFYAEMVSCERETPER